MNISPSISPAYPGVNFGGRMGGSPMNEPGTVASADPRAADKSATTDNAREDARSGAEKGQQIQLSEAELKEVSELKARDREVRAHETAHQATGGQYASAPSYEYERGPDGVQYAVGGEVQIDIAPVDGDPQATVEKMRIVRAAALAPAEPSGQDRAVAAEATQLMLQAQMEMAQESRDQRSAASAGDNPRGSAAVTAYNSIADSAPAVAAQESPGFQATA